MGPWPPASGPAAQPGYAGTMAYLVHLRGAGVAIERAHDGSEVHTALARSACRPIREAAEHTATYMRYESASASRGRLPAPMGVPRGAGEGHARLS